MASALHTPGDVRRRAVLPLLECGKRREDEEVTVKSFKKIRKKTM